MANEDLKLYLEDYLKEQDYYKPNKDKKFLCRNPTHADHDPSMSFKKSLNIVRCFSCGTTYDIIGLVEVDKGYSYKQAVDYLRNKYQGKPLPAGYDAKAISAIKPLEEELSNLGNGKGIEYLGGRGFSHAQAIAQAFNIKSDDTFIYFPHRNYKIVGEGSILTTTDYEARYFHPVETEGAKAQRYKHKGRLSLYDFPQILSYKHGMVNIAICEGEIDSLCFYDLKIDAKEELKGLFSIALGGVANTNLLESKLSTIEAADKENYHFLLALDNDNAGKEGTKKLGAILEKLGFHYSTYDLLNADKPIGKGGYKDINDRLQNDREGLLNDLKAYMKDFSNIESNEKTSFEKEKEEYLVQNASKNHLNALLSDFSSENANLPIDTGFKALNRLFYGVSQGVITLGAMSSTGKTTFFLQMADQIASKNERDVLYISLEQSGKELVAKSISRLTFLNAKKLGDDATKAQSVFSILTTKADGNGGYTKMDDISGNRIAYSQNEAMFLSESLRQYDQLTNRLFIITPQDSNSLTIDKIEDAVKKHIEATGNTPIVFVDYLQIIASGDNRLTDKQAVDINFSDLRRICSKYGLLTFVISSINRTSYDSLVTMASYKESGQIEYGSDILLGLNFTRLEKPINTKEENADDVIDVESNRDVRQIFVKLLKNRNNAKAKKVYFNYYAKYNTMIELNCKDGIEDMNSALKAIDSLNDSIEDDLPF